MSYFVFLCVVPLYVPQSNLGRSAVRLASSAIGLIPGFMPTQEEEAGPYTQVLDIRKAFGR